MCVSQYLQWGVNELIINETGPYLTGIFVEHVPAMVRNRSGFTAMFTR